VRSRRDACAYPLLLLRTLRRWLKAGEYKTSGSLILYNDHDDYDDIPYARFRSYRWPRVDAAPETSLALLTAFIYYSMIRVDLEPNRALVRGPTKLLPLSRAPTNKARDRNEPHLNIAYSCV
jgi:hypothetical protein